MGRVHRFLGLSVGLIQRGMTAEERRSNYRFDITYTNNSELGFDYLRDNLASSSEQLVMRWPRPFHFAIVDEVDSVLIDEGRNPLMISGELGGLTGGAAISWLLGPAWKLESVSGDGHKAFVDRAPIFTLTQILKASRYHYFLYIICFKLN